MRSETARHAVLEATRDQLSECGYDKLSIDRVAAAAGVGKQTVYRWYPSKSALVAECALEGYFLADSIAVPDTGDAYRDLRDWLRAFAEHNSEPHTASLFRASVAATADSEDVAARFHERFIGSLEEALAARMRAAERAGQIQAGSSPAVVAQALVGGMIYRVLNRRPLTAGAADELVDAVFAGIGQLPGAVKLA
ncbi:TetR/AcrR family transcriptional regulator [Pseudofrankia sp. EUN1h]|uniref:TetR/AcrR family transcriptional regulator n=1 Tax=Pseudofrankia sp. EUN1h TaxID=1834515 RepID=UPI0002F88A10|nr:TetR/AcrR family transcriptional regulator [Pseudofrankia sp. EUN1h]